MRHGMMSQHREAHMFCLIDLQVQRMKQLFKGIILGAVQRKSDGILGAVTVSTQFSMLC
jgi:hypothetical protein